MRDRIPVYWSRCGVIRARCAEYFDGKVIDRPAVRTVDDLKAAAREARDRGYKAIKANLLVFDKNGGRQYTPGSARGPGHPELNLPEEMLDALIAQLTALREGAGPKVRIAVDVNFNYKAEGFRRIARKVEPFDLMWLEMDMYEPQALASHPAVDHDPDRVARDDPRPPRAQALSRSALRRCRDHRSAI